MQPFENEPVSARRRRNSAATDTRIPITKRVLGRRSSSIFLKSRSVRRPFEPSDKGLYEGSTGRNMAGAPRHFFLQKYPTAHTLYGLPAGQVPDLASTMAAEYPPGTHLGRAGNRPDRDRCLMGTKGTEPVGRPVPAGSPDAPLRSPHSFTVRRNAVQGPHRRIRHADRPAPCPPPR